MGQRARIVARARACIGASFRLQGRDPATGLDCVGLAAIALAVDPPPARYGLRGGDAVEFIRAISGVGLRPAPAETAGVGDLVMVEAGPHQFHLLVLSEAGFIHADARLRKVVEVPGPPPWPRLQTWTT